MKKQMKLFVMTLISLFAFTGCMEKELKPIEVLEKALKNTQEVNSLTMNASIDLKMEQDGAVVEMPIDLGIAMEMENDTTGKFKMSLSENPFISAMDLYLDMQGETSKVYMPSSLIAMMLGFEEDESHWIVTETTNEEGTTEENIDITAELEKLKNVDFSKVFKEEDFVYVDEEGSVKHYTLTITQDLMNRISSAMGEEVSEENTFESLKVELYIDTENNRFTKVSINLLDVVKSLMEEMENEESTIDLSGLQVFTMSLSLTNYNSTVVEIPENVVNEALTTEEYLQIYIGEE